MKKIDSLQNAFIKKVVKLRDDRKFRESEKLFVVEGEREILRALQCGFELESFLVVPDQIQRVIKEFKVADDIIVEISNEILEKVCVREDSKLGTAVLKFPTRRIDSDKIFARQNLRVVVLEDTEKPGNLGAIARTAAGFGLDALICLGKTVDPWNPNAIRSSLGAVFELPIFSMEYENFFETCQKQSVKVVGAVVDHSAKFYFEILAQSKMAFVFGSEAVGMTEKCRSFIDQASFIPMKSKVIDSFNLSVAVGIYLGRFCV